MKRLSEGNCGDELSLDKDKFDASIIFDDRIAKFADDHLKNPQDPDDNDVVSDSALQNYVFQECIMQSKRTNKSGKKSCRYSFLMIRFAISLKLKLGKGRYDFIAKCFNLPSDSHLSGYKSPSVGAPDEILFDTLEAERTLFENLNGSSLPMDDWKRHGSLAWGSMVIKEKLYFYPNTMRIVGYTTPLISILS